MEDVAEYPGMHSDRPGTTPKSRILGELPFHVQEMKKMGWRCMARVWWRKRETLEYMTGQPGPTARPIGADFPLIPRGPSVIDFIKPSEPAQFLSLFYPARADRPLSFGGPSTTQRFKPDRTALFLVRF